MLTNLFFVLRDALAWIAAHGGATLRLDLNSEGLKVLAQVPDQPDQKAGWSVSAVDVLKSFATDPAPVVTPVPTTPSLEDRIGSELRAYLTKPLGSEALVKTLLAEGSLVSAAVVSRAATLQARVDAGENIDPFPPTPARDPLPRVRLQDLLRGVSAG